MEDYVRRSTYISLKHFLIVILTLLNFSILRLNTIRKKLYLNLNTYKHFFKCIIFIKSLPSFFLISWQAIYTVFEDL